MGASGLEKEILHLANEVQTIATKSVIKPESDTLYRSFTKMRDTGEEEQEIKKAAHNG